MSPAVQNWVSLRKATMSKVLAGICARPSNCIWRLGARRNSVLAKGTLADILKQSGLTLDEFLEFLRGIVLQNLLLCCMIQNKRFDAVECVCRVSKTLRAEIIFELL